MIYVLVLINSSYFEKSFALLQPEGWPCRAAGTLVPWQAGLPAQPPLGDDICHCLPAGMAKHLRRDHGEDEAAVPRGHKQLQEAERVEVAEGTLLHFALITPV